MTPFVHESERLFAGLLDFYGIAWQYEPTAFDVAHDEHGRVVERFAPDFYLPEFDLYVELTTMNQRLVTRKHRKLRKLHQTHPDVRCKILYQRDIHRLAAVHGVDFPSAALTDQPASA